MGTLFFDARAPNFVALFGFRKRKKNQLVVAVDVVVSLDFWLLAWISFEVLEDLRYQKKMG